jgi:nucleotide-binding universal stress UspA family protein
MASIKNILISVNESETSLKAVRYVGEMSGCLAGLHVRLLHVAPEPPPYYYLEGNSLKDYVREKEAKAEEIFRAAVKILTDSGMPQERISTRTYIAERAEAISSAILKVQKEGNYGTVVVGKRGVSKAEEFLFGSISNAVAHNCASFTVWIVA